MLILIVAIPRGLAPPMSLCLSNKLREFINAGRFSLFSVAKRFELTLSLEDFGFFQSVLSNPENIVRYRRNKVVGSISVDRKAFDSFRRVVIVLDQIVTLLFTSCVFLFLHRVTRTRQLILFVLPSFTLGPNFSWERRLNALNNFYLRLEAKQNYISTIGGGAFLCGRLDLAIKSALIQLELANVFGNPKMLAKARLHFVYIAIAAGHYSSAARYLRSLRKYAITLNDPSYLELVESAWLTLKGYSRARKSNLT